MQKKIHTCEHSGITFEVKSEYNEGYFDAMNAILEKALKIGKMNTFQLDGMSGISCMIRDLTDIVSQRPKK